MQTQLSDKLQVLTRLPNWAISGVTKHLYANTKSPFHYGRVHPD